MNSITLQLVLETRKLVTCVISEEFCVRHNINSLVVVKLDDSSRPRETSYNINFIISKEVRNKSPLLTTQVLYLKSPTLPLHKGLIEDKPFFS